MLPDNNDKASSGAEKLSTVPRLIFMMPRKSTLNDYWRKPIVSWRQSGFMNDNSINATSVLIDAGSSRPVEYVDQFPWILCEIPLQLPCVTKHEFGSGIQDAGALALVLIVNLEDAGSEIE